MALTDTFVSKPPPVMEDDNGTIRVGGTRVTLDTVIGHFLEGCTADEIAIELPVLKLHDVYGAISYYLANRTVIDEYLSERAKEAEKLKATIEAELPVNGIRDRLIARSQRNS